MYININKGICATHFQTWKYVRYSFVHFKLSHNVIFFKNITENASI